ncbi:MAG: c-type cytochrome [Sphingobacteriia bacterium]|nr:c-type cytochrome [Sphingobacteriia bacterium]NCC38566.1 c-type cytochrome [Gammaproteobacteria bacterium]
MSGEITLFKFIAAGTFVLTLTAYAADEPRQPTAPGIESPGYTWNQIADEQMIALMAVGDPDHGAVVFEVCAGCHGMAALGTDDGAYPRLAGQHASVLIKELTDIRSGVRDNPKMFPFADQHVISTKEVADIAAYLTGLPVSADQGQGPGSDLERGERLYRKDCVKCHGRAGEGDAESFYPKLAGQHYAYLLRQVRNIHGGLRRNADPQMVEATGGYAEADMESVSDYISRLPLVGDAQP